MDEPLLNRDADDWAYPALTCDRDCAWFKPVDDDPGGEWGRCTHPRSPLCGFPVRRGRDCPRFQPRTDQNHW